MKHDKVDSFGKLAILAGAGYDLICSGVCYFNQNYDKAIYFAILTVIMLLLINTMRDW